MKKKIIFILAAAVMAFVSAFSFAGCELASNVQKNCNHNWVLQKNSSSLREATCSEQGISAVYKCIKCQKMQYEFSPKLPHTFNAEDDELVYSCGSPYTSINQTCTECNEVVSVRLPFTLHKMGEAVYHEAYEATLVDIGVYTQEEYDSLSEDQLKSDYDKYFYELKAMSVCAYTERKCSLCGYAEKICEHSLNDFNRELLNQAYEDAENNGGCGGSFSCDCERCGEFVQYFFHAYEEEEIVYSSSELIIRKMLCKYCRDEVKYEVEFL